MRYFFLRRYPTAVQSGLQQYWYEIVENVREHPLEADQERAVAVLHSEEAGRLLVEELNAQRLKGVVEGMRRFAWWKEGVEYVGTCGTTLKQAIADLERERGG